MYTSCAQGLSGSSRRQEIAPIVIDIRGMSSNPFPNNLMLLPQSINFLPKIPVFNGLFALSFNFVQPIVGFPTVNPFRYSVSYILGVRPDSDRTWLL